MPAVCCGQMNEQLSTTCPDHPDREDCPDALVTQRSDGVVGPVIHDGGSSMVPIGHCPWCGAPLGATGPPDPGADR